MDIKEYEDTIRKKISEVILDIVENNKSLPIPVKSRGGAEISDFLETEFVKKTKRSKTLLRSESAPKGKTKNPWDARTFFKLNDHEEEIWIDFKAFKIKENSDSNPDLGTPDKIFNFIEEGGFYLLYVYVYYTEDEDGMCFVEYDNQLIKSYFLKDVSSTVRRTSTNQLQVNFTAEPEYRTRADFLELLTLKVNEGLERQIKIAQSKLEKLASIKEKTNSQNIESENNLEISIKNSI